MRGPKRNTQGANLQAASVSTMEITIPRKTIATAAKKRAAPNGEIEVAGVG
jgi:hypothetical protein